MMYLQFLVEPCVLVYEYLTFFNLSSWDLICFELVTDSNSGRAKLTWRTHNTLSQYNLYSLSYKRAFCSSKPCSIRKRRREEMSEIGLEDHVLLWSVLNFNCFQISLINVNFHVIVCLISFDWNSFIIKFPNCCWIIDFCVYYRRFYHK